MFDVFQITLKHEVVPTYTEFYQIYTKKLIVKMLVVYLTTFRFIQLVMLEMVTNTYPHSEN